jgi:nucleotide-binding universal stress UspA family protein
MTAQQPTQLSPLARFDNILVATDQSKYSAAAVAVAIAMSAKSGARLHPFAMVLTNPEYEALAPELVQKAAEEARAHLEGVVASARGQGVVAEPMLVSGSVPEDEIVEAASERNADVIVMGQQGRRRLARMMVGHATVRVIGSAKCSVLAVPEGAKMWERRVLLGTDGSRFGDAAAVTAAKVAHCCNVPITVLSALVPSHSEKRQQEGRDAVERTVTQLRAQGVQAEGAAIPGEADDIILKCAAETRADLIVLGTHGRTGFGKVMLGSVCERVLGKTTCPVLVVRA